MARHLTKQLEMGDLDTGKCFLLQVEIELIFCFRVFKVFRLDNFMHLELL